MYPIQQFNKSLFTAQAMTATVSSLVQDVSTCIRLSIQASWAGTVPVGTLHVQCSNDGLNFNDDPEVTPIAISGATGSSFNKIVNCSYPFLRLTYTFTSGTGTLNVTVSGKNQ